jgi:hypothetical protein
MFHVKHVDSRNRPAVSGAVVITARWGECFT